jgi:hypothetical protein
MADEKNPEIDFSVNRQNLYLEETFTDLKVASIRRLTPVKPDGSVDKTRKTLFVGQTHLISPNGPIPIQNIIQAKDLQQAVKNFPEAMMAAVDRLVEEANKMKVQENSRIIKDEPRIIVPGR